MENKDFIAFILTHGRADNVLTFKSLKKHGYTGRIVLIVDNEDKQIEEYKANFGEENVVIFNKKEISETFDEGDNFEKRNVIIYARNACFEIAKQLGYKYFIELDDDYTEFSFRHDKDLVFKSKGVGNLDEMFDLMVNFLELNSNIKSVAMSQSGDYIGGGHGSFGDIKLHRKCMNSFVCSIDRPFQFIGRINEDVNTYVTLGGRGDLFFTLPTICLNQKETQSNKGGMTEAYLDNGTYVKSFFSVMYSPSCVKVSMMGSKNLRLHHKVSWNNAVPKILSETTKKQ